MNECLGKEVIILSNQVKHYLHQAAESEGISGAQSRILHFLFVENEKRDVFQKDIEETFFLGRSTVTQTLQSMEKKGLILRSGVAWDARLKKLELTEQGRVLDARITRKVEHMEQQLKSNLSREEIQQFHVLINKMSENISELSEDKGECMKAKKTR